jgi:hypothetical protein
VTILYCHVSHLLAKRNVHASLYILVCH